MSTETDSERVRVLLIDDSELLLEVVGEQLVSWGYQVETADGGREGIALLEQQRFDVVITDVVMPEVGGLDVLQTVRERQSDDVPVILLSSYSQSETLMEAMRLGAFDYVIKDDGLDLLRSAVERASGHLQLLRDNTQLLENLRDMNQLLERRVGERTFQLERANRHLTHERSELERTLYTLNETQGQLVQSERMASVGLLTAGVAHEINNPLAFIMPGVSALEDGMQRLASEDLEDAKALANEMVQIARECKQGLARIADIVRELSMFAQAGDTLPERVKLPELVEAVLKLFGSNILMKARLQLDLEKAPDVYADPAKLRQVVLNVLVGAMQAVEHQTDRPEISVEGGEEGKWVLLRVTDNRRAPVKESGKEPKVKGFAGAQSALIISRQLLSQMGGSIAVESADDRTAVILKLPRWQDDHPDSSADVPAE